jgi:ribosomal protein S27E
MSTDLQEYDVLETNGDSSIRPNYDRENSCNFIKVSTKTRLGDIVARVIRRIDNWFVIDRDPKSPFLYKRCGSCGSSKIERSCTFDSRHGEEHVYIKCQVCGWCG